MWFFRRKRNDITSSTGRVYAEPPPYGAPARDPQAFHAIDPWAPQPGEEHGFLETSSTNPRTQNRPLLRLALSVVGVMIAIPALWLGAMMFYYTLKFPDPFAVRRDGKAPVIRILARDGATLAERGTAHPYIPIVMLPPHVIHAVLATEDRRFFKHWGVDPLGLARATFANMRAGRFTEGGSTLTQQLAKNLFLSHERTLTRKIDELALALWLECRLEKREILELYLNRVYFGGGAYGIEAAAQRYFGVSARALNVAQAALIAGLLKAPSRYAPTTNPGAGRARGRTVLRKMHAAGFLSETQLKNAMQQPVRFAIEQSNKIAPHDAYAVDYILDRLPRLLDSGHSNIMVETTIDAQLQRRATDIIGNTIRTQGTKRRATQAAMVVLDRNGGVRALVGGVDYRKSQYNRATTAHRQPGSTFKPFVYLAALEAGYRPETITYDLPLSLNGWTPRNADGTYTGTVTVRDALAKSINTVAVRVALDVGPENVARVSRRLGISATLRADPSLALGTSEVPLLNLVGAYNVFANGGRATTPHIIDRIRTNGGRILYARPGTSETQIVAPKNVGAMNEMLNHAMITGTGRRAMLNGWPAAGKTGTSQQFRDAWFIGYTAHMSAGVWVGNDDGKPMRKVSGGSLPADIWREVMTAAHTGKTVLPLPYTARAGTRISTGPSTFRDSASMEGRVPAARNTRAALRTRTAHARTVNLRQVIPPLPVRRPASRFPNARISEKFIADLLPKRALAAPLVQNARTSDPRDKPAANGMRSGFDSGAIRRKLNQQAVTPQVAHPAQRVRPANPANGKMALGAQAIAKTPPTSPAP